MTFIIDVLPLSLTYCSGRDRQYVVVKWKGGLRGSLLMCHCHLLAAVVSGSEVEKARMFGEMQLYVEEHE